MWGAGRMEGSVSRAGGSREDVGLSDWLNLGICGTEGSRTEESRDPGKSLCAAWCVWLGF